MALCPDTNAHKQSRCGNHNAQQVMDLHHGVIVQQRQHQHTDQRQRTVNPEQPERAGAANFKAEKVWYKQTENQHVDGEKHRQGKLIQMRCSRPEKLERRTFIHHVEQQKRQHKAGIKQVAAFARGKKDKQIVEAHHNHGGVVAAAQNVVGQQFILQGVVIHQGGRNLEGSLRFHAHQQHIILLWLQRYGENNVRMIDVAVIVKGLQVAALLIMAVGSRGHVVRAQPQLGQIQQGIPYPQIPV